MEEKIITNKPITQIVKEAKCPSECRDAMNKMVRRYIENLFSMIDVNLALLKETDRRIYDNGKVLVFVGKKSDSTLMTTDLIESLHKKIRNNSFPTEQDIQALEQDIKNNPKNLINKTGMIVNIIDDLKELLCAYSTSEMAKSMKERFDKRRSEIMNSMDEVVVTEQKEVEEEKKRVEVMENIVKDVREKIMNLCTVDFFNQFEFDVYFEMVLKTAIEYNPKKNGKLSEEDLIIINFLRIDNILHRALKDKNKEVSDKK